MQFYQMTYCSPFIIFNVVWVNCVTSSCCYTCLIMEVHNISIVTINAKAQISSIKYLWLLIFWRVNDLISFPYELRLARSETLPADFVPRSRRLGWPTRTNYKSFSKGICSQSLPNSSCAVQCVSEKFPQCLSATALFST